MEWLVYFYYIDLMKPKARDTKNNVFNCWYRTISVVWLRGHLGIESDFLKEYMCIHLLIQSSLCSSTGISTLFCQPCYQQPKESLLFSVQSNLLSHALEVKMTSTKNDYNNPSTNV